MVFKIWGIAFFMLILLVGVVSLQVNTAVKKELREQLKIQGLSYAESLAKLAPDYIFTENYYGLYELLSSTRLQNQAIAYIMILDTEGNVIISTFSEGIPEGLLDLNRIKPGQRYSIRTFNSSEGLIEDIAVPILNLRAGYVRVGLTEQTINVFISGINRTIIWLTLAVSFLGLFISYILAYLITSPLNRLRHSIKAVEQGNFNQEVRLFGLKDEVGELAYAFNQMLARLKQANDELMQKEKQRQMLLKKVIFAQEEERKRISRELHDEIGQALTSILISLKYLEGHLPEEQRHLLTDIRNLTAQTIDELKDLALSLRPSVLDNLGLLPAIKNLVRHWENRYGLTINLHLNLPSNFKLRNEAESSLYRVVQEALTNIARHAMASRVRLVFRIKNENLILKIADNGRGFSLNPVSEKSLGLIGMIERISLLGGNLQILSKPGKGTMVKIQLPLKEVIL
ncbi:HAMP domain-containing sensor histidine kinase [Carboxydothermus ferrireducens]|nr:histidine kinase [Carboxydothermus ferrireducens]